MKANKIIVGAGKLFFAKQREDGSFAGERYFGDTPGFSLNPTVQTLEIYDHDEQVQQKLEDVTTRIDRTVNITCRNVSIENIAMFVIGGASVFEQDSASITDEEIASVEQGHYYQLGISAARPSGARQISNMVVTDDGGTPVTFDVNDDYTVDLALGRLYIVPGGAIEDGTTLLVDYDIAETEWPHVSSNNLRPVRGRLRYVANNTTGPNHDVMIPLAEVRPNGELQMKDRSNPVQISLTAAAQSLEGFEQLYVDGRPVAS